MTNEKIRLYQKKAVESIIKAIQQDSQNYMLISMPVGTGVSSVIIETCNMLKQMNCNSRFLIIVNRLTLEQHFLDSIQDKCYNDHLAEALKLVTYQQLRSGKFDSELLQADYVVCYEAQYAAGIEKLGFKDGAVYIGTLVPSVQLKQSCFAKAPIVFKYSLSEAVYDGIILPAEAPQHYEEAILGFCLRLFNCLGGKTIKPQNADYTNIDANVVIDEKCIAVECKVYRDRHTSAHQLQHVIARLSRTINNNGADLGVIILFSEFDQSEAQQIFEKNHIAIWDISNLLFLTQTCPNLYNEIHHLSLFPASNIKQQQPPVWYPKQKVHFSRTQDVTLENSAQRLMARLKVCASGKEMATEYEKICADIIKFLFADMFSRIEVQNRTKDGLFRMDIICAIKETGSFWGLIRHYYNSHFIVFECKNYAKRLSQELIYSTEKYLYNSALRNVCIMISRKGFSLNASKAADGCLKEHGKLILDITDEDLAKMINKKVSGEDPADYLIDKLEETLMSIGK